MAKVQAKASGKFVARGGSGKMFGQMGAKPSKPGVISESQMGKGDNYACGGTTKMFGKQSATPAKPA